MKRYGYRAAAVLSLLCALGAGVSETSAHDGKSRKVDAKLYEVTENMSLDNLSTPTVRSRCVWRWMLLPASSRAISMRS